MALHNKWLFLSLLGLPVSCVAGVSNVSVCNASPSVYRSISITGDDAAIVELPDGAIAVVQFTGFGRGEATYRWKFRDSASAPAKSGIGREPTSQGATS